LAPDPWQPGQKGDQHVACRTSQLDDSHVLAPLLVDDLAPKPGKRGPYKKIVAATEISN
jgi:hypothetical protein